MFKKVKESMGKMGRKIEDEKNYQIEFLEVKNSISEMKTTLGINNRLQTSHQTRCKPEGSGTTTFKDRKDKSSRLRILYPLEIVVFGFGFGFT